MPGVLVASALLLAALTFLVHSWRTGRPRSSMPPIAGPVFFSLGVGVGLRLMDGGWRHPLSWMFPAALVLVALGGWTQRRRARAMTQEADGGPSTPAEQDPLAGTHGRGPSG